MLKRITAFFLASLMMMLTCGAVFSADETTESDVVRFGVFSDSHSYMSYIEDVFDEDFYNFENNDIENVDAWMPKPKPYKKSEEV